ncbi:GNAT family N-acetyltransferase [Xinfangfangia sp. D13-10-4-6]|uniref:GNAT family N-acetyltransferase n=1 Tax=Pseudogemmobacter hezensis TaxID=2737662 RepID=UPI001553B587|nr:GNAT family N-acetyltransferase [Pseudogemmobacter hezensis]NPD15441.1 GNAT family N-acetyltransferase [Pseudogemmobacter hezensis]
MSFVTLTSDRLILRAPEAGDLAAFTAFAGSARTRYVGAAKTPAQAAEKFASMIGQWHLRGYGRFTITDRASGAPLGHAGPLHFDMDAPVDLTWSLWSAEAEGRGIASEAARLVHDWMAADGRFAGAVTSIHRDNHASKAVARKIGGVESTAPSPHLADAVLWHFPLKAEAAA